MTGEKVPALLAQILTLCTLLGVSSGLAPLLNLQA